MNSLDKDVMYFFYDELEKNAIFVPAGKGLWWLVRSASKGAYEGAKGYGKWMSNLAGGSGWKRNLGGVALGAVGIKSGVDAVKHTGKQYKALAAHTPTHQVGNLDLGGL